MVLAVFCVRGRGPLRSGMMGTNAVRRLMGVLDAGWRGGTLHGLRALFRLLAWGRPLPGGPCDPTRVRALVIFSTAGIGDTLSDTPAIRALRERFAAASFVAVVHRRRQEVLEHNPHIDRLVPHHKGPAGFFRSLRVIHAARPDVAVILRANDPEILPLAYLSGAHTVVGRPANTRFAFLINRPAPVPDWHRLHGVEQTLAVVRELGAETADPRLVFCVSAQARERIRRHLALRGLEGEALVAMQIHASPRLAFRDWPEASFIALGRAILQKHPVRLVLTGGRGDREKAASIQRALGERATYFAGELSLGDTAALLERCQALLTTDTGVMHLGFAVGVPTLALLHPFNAYRVGPYGYGERHRAVVLEGPMEDEQGNLRSLAKLPPERAYAAFCELLGREAAPRNP